MTEPGLLAIIDHSGRQLKWLSKACQKISVITDIVRISSIYSDEFDGEKNDEKQEKPLVAAVQIKWKGPTNELLQNIKRIEEELTLEATQSVVDILILALGSELIMTPQLTLPHPRLHSQAQLLYPAAEIAPAFIHPVLNKDLKTLAGHLGLRWGRFYEQGSRLMDFLST